MGRIEQIDAQQRPYSEYDREALVDRNRLTYSSCEHIVLWYDGANQLEYQGQDRAADHQVDKQDMQQKQRDQQYLQSARIKGQRKGQVARHGYLLQQHRQR